MVYYLKYDLVKYHEYGFLEKINDCKKMSLICNIKDPRDAK
jgi:hypothetical protein